MWSKSAVNSKGRVGIKDGDTTIARDVRESDAETIIKAVHSNNKKKPATKNPPAEAATITFEDALGFLKNEHDKRPLTVKGAIKAHLGL